MPIRWSALQVSEAMDGIEALVEEAEPFFTQARQKAREAETIPDLPGYIDDRLKRLIWEIERIEAVRAAIARVRRDIPEEALKAERAMAKQPAFL